MKKFGEKVKFYRKQSGLTQEQLAEKCDCSKQTISGTETGYSFPSSKVLFNLSKTLNVPLVYLFNFGDDENLSNKEFSTMIEKYIAKLTYEQKVLVMKVLQFISEEQT